jgi:cytidylate kinase
MTFTIAIDGPAGAGKSTVARRIAAALDFTYLDTGAMYRAVAWKSARSGTPPTEEAALAALAGQVTIAFSPLDADGQQRVFVDGEDVTEAIRTPENSSLTSTISAVPAVRRVIVAQQQRMGREATRGVVLEGRDIGTVVFPRAQVKIFLTAGPEERARRRVEELQAKGMAVDYARILAEQSERDYRDSRRVTSPLVPAPDAVLLDTDSLPVEAVVTRILELIQERMEVGGSRSRHA